jgi:hypothetical protein
VPCIARPGSDDVWCSAFAVSDDDLIQARSFGVLAGKSGTTDMPSRSRSMTCGPPNNEGAFHAIVQILAIKSIFTPEAGDHQECHRRHGRGGRREMRGVTWVKADEIESGDRGIGGQCLTTEADKSSGRQSGRLIRAGRKPPKNETVG